MFGKKIDIEKYIAGSIEGLQIATVTHSQTWQLGSEGTWNVNQDFGTLEWYFENGTIATAAAQIVGTYNLNDGTFMWGWEHPAVDRSMQNAAAKVRKFGRKNQVEEFTTHVVTCTQDRAWAYTAVAMRLSNENGGFRAIASPTTHVFMTFGRVSLKKA